MNYDWSHWKILKITPMKGEPLYKVFACYYKEEWRFNSGITKYVELEDRVEFFGNSGSVYICPKEGMDQCHWSWTGVLTNLLNAGGGLVEVEEISFEQFKKEFSVA